LSTVFTVVVFIVLCAELQNKKPSYSGSI